MSLLIRELILQSIELALREIDGTAGYSMAVKNVSRHDHPVADAQVYPSIDVSVAGESRTGSDIVGLNDILHLTLRVRVRLHVKGSATTVSEGISDVIRAVLSDPFRDQNAHWTDFSGDTEVNAEQQWADVIFEVRYSILRDNPSVRA